MLARYTDDTRNTLSFSTTKPLIRDHEAQHLPHQWRYVYQPPNIVPTPIFNVESNGALGGSRYLECGNELGRDIGDQRHNFVADLGSPLLPTTEEQ